MRIFCLLLIFISFVNGQKSFANFEPTHLRYTSGPGFFAQIYPIFSEAFDLAFSLPEYAYVFSPEVKIENDIFDNCFAISSKNSNLIGLNSPNTGRPIYSGPSGTFVGWINFCSVSWVKLDLIGNVSMENSNYNLVKAKAINKYFKSLSAQILKNYTPRVIGIDSYYSSELLHQKATSVLSSEDIQKVIAEDIQEIIGPDEVIADFGFSTSIQALAGEIYNQMSLNSETTLIELAIKIKQKIILRDEFLSY